MPDSIDFNREGSPLLLDGWYGPEGDSRFKYRWTEQEFSILVPEGTTSLEMFATAPHVSDLDGHVTMDVIIGQEKIVSVTLYNSEFRRYSIPLQRRITERTQGKFVLNRYYCPREEEKKWECPKIGAGNQQNRLCRVETR